MKSLIIANSHERKAIACLVHCIQAKSANAYFIYIFFLNGQNHCQHDCHEGELTSEQILEIYLNLADINYAPFGLKLLLGTFQRIYIQCARLGQRLNIFFIRINYIYASPLGRGGGGLIKFS